MVHILGKLSGRCSLVVGVAALDATVLYVFGLWRSAATYSGPPRSANSPAGDRRR
jgi:hypothetical protein